MYSASHPRPPPKPPIKEKVPKTHGKTTASYGGKPNENSEVLPSSNGDKGKGNSEHGANTEKSG